MRQRRQVYEQHLVSYKNALSEWSTVLKGRQLEDKEQTKDTTFRKIKGKIRQFERRLRALDKVAAVNAETEARRAQRLATPKVKEKKAKAPASAATKPKKKTS